MRMLTSSLFKVVLGRTSVTFGLALTTVFVGVDSSATAAPQNLTIIEPFTTNQPLDAYADFKSSAAILVVNQQVNVPTDGSTNKLLTLRPTNPAPPGNDAWWTLDRTERAWYHSEFEINAAIGYTRSGSGFLEEGRAAVYFSSNDITAAGKNSAAGPLAIVEILADRDTSGDNFYVNVSAKQSSLVGSTIYNLFGPVLIAPITGVAKRFSIDFAWDYHVTPRMHNPALPPPHHKGLAWAYVRIMWQDVGSNVWNTVVPPPSTLYNIDKITINGWIPFGDDQRNSDWTIPPPPPPAAIGFDYYQWSTKANTTPVPIYPYFWFSNFGSSVTDTVTWTMDNMTLAPHKFDSFSLMSNESGYDVASPIWAAVRPNDPALLGNPNAVDHIIWSLKDSNGTPLTIASATTGPGTPSFIEVTDLERWFNNGTQWGFTTQPVYWWRWEPPSIAPLDRVGCTIQATVYDTPTHIAATLSSDPFDFHYEESYRSIVPGVALGNEFQRRGGVNDSYGWFDASGRYGEARSHGAFVSALAHVLRMRRPELSTAELHSPSGSSYMGYFDAVKWGADYLYAMGAAENVLRVSTHTLNLSGDEDQGHYLSLGDSVAMAGHIYEENHSRLAQDPDKSDDSDASSKNIVNKAERIFAACLGLIDAARTLKSHDSAAAANYFAQANDTRTYLYSLRSHFGYPGPPPPTNDAVFVTLRAQALLDLAFYDYTGNPQDLSSAMTKIRSDLDAYPPTISSNLDDWTLDGHPNHEAMIYSPTAVICEFIERGYSDPTMHPGALSWHDALAAVASNWYDPMVSPTYNNPLYTTRFWGENVNHDAFEGDQVYTDKKVAQDAVGVARLAIALGRGDPTYQHCVRLAVGNMNWLQGLHFGISGRQASPPKDIEHVAASLISRNGSRWALQTIPGYDEWSLPTTVSGIFGSRLDHGSNTGPDVPPWNYATSEFDSSEAFILYDGAAIMAAESLSRLLHPRQVIEAESASASSPPNPTVVSNNVPNFPNGGLSVTSLNAGDWLEYDFLPPEPYITGQPAIYDYELLLRVSNTASVPLTVTVLVSTMSGSPIWTRSVSVASTGAQHNYIIVAHPDRVALTSGTSYKLRLTFPNGLSAIDSIVVKSAGIGR